MKVFSVNLKKLRNQHHMNQTEVAKYLGVGQTTIANYEKGIRLPNQETLRQLALLFNTSSDYLIGMEQVIDEHITLSYKELELLKNQFLTYVLNDEEAKAIALIVNQAKTKRLAIEIIEHVIVSSMYQVGKLWYEGQIDVAKEHFITAIARKLLNRISSVFISESIEKSNQKKAICLTYYDEQHTMGVEIISEYLKLLGYKTFYLGASTPVEDLIQMIEDKEANLIAFSITRKLYLDELEKTINNIRNHCSQKDINIIVGGQGVVEAGRLVIPLDVDGFATDFKSLEILINKF